MWPFLEFTKTSERNAERKDIMVAEIRGEVDTDGVMSSSTSQDAKQTELIGFSFSPGGLLFPYHLGVLSCLKRHGYVTDQTPIAGSSAGAIAVAAFATGVNPYDAMNSCIRISLKCEEQGGARGRLLSLLEEELRHLVPKDGHERIRRRPGFTGIAYQEIFPKPKSVLAAEFESRDDLIEAICNSSMFPFFTSNTPFVIRKAKSSAAVPVVDASVAPLPTGVVEANEEIVKNEVDAPPEEILNSYLSSGVTIKETDKFAHNNEEKNPKTTLIDLSSDDKIDLVKSFSKLFTFGCDAIRQQDHVHKMQQPSQVEAMKSSFFSNLTFENMPRLVVDGFFTTSRSRFGCPEFPTELRLARTVTVSCFPHKAVGLSVSELHDRICPPLSADDSTVIIMRDLFRRASTPANVDEIVEMFERGRVDAERWVDLENERLGQKHPECLENSLKQKSRTTNVLDVDAVAMAHEKEPPVLNGEKGNKR